MIMSKTNKNKKVKRKKEVMGSINKGAVNAKSSHFEGKKWDLIKLTITNLTKV